MFVNVELSSYRWLEVRERRGFGKIVRMRRLAVALLGFLASVPASVAEEMPVVGIGAEELHARLQGAEVPMVIDVREPDEFEAGHIGVARLAPLATVTKALEQTPRETEIVLVCRSGRRSGIAYRALAELGFTRLANLEGGMLEWEKLGYPVVKGK